MKELKNDQKEEWQYEKIQINKMNIERILNL